jgi:membrane dipeptidase
MRSNLRLTRRDMLTMGAAAWASQARPEGCRDTDLFRGAVVLDGNLVAGALIDGVVVDKATSAQIRASGLTAFKQTLGGSTDSFHDTQNQISSLKSAIERNAHLFTKVEHASQIAEAKLSGRVGVMFSFESASMFEGRLTSIDHFANEGVRVMGLSYNVGSVFGSGAMQPTKSGLTPLGREALARMNLLGVTVDISHSSEAAGLDAVAASDRQVLITHGGCAAVHPHPRNKSDRLLRAVADRGGVVGIYDLSYLGNYPASPTLDTYIRHLVHALNVCGEDHVGIGSDTELMAVDTSPASIANWSKKEADRKAAGVMAPEEGPLPSVVGLNGPGRWEAICEAMLRRGYSRPAAEKVLGSNFARAFTATWSVRT